jgi:hypothetical protein
MPAALITSDELTAIRVSTRAHLAELLEEPGIADDVVGLERIGVALLAAFDAPQAPAELGKALVDTLAERGCDASAGLLVVLAAFGREAIANEALEATRTLGDHNAAVADAVGTLTVREVWRGAIASGEVWVAILDRPGYEAPQAACLTLATDGDGPIAVVGGLLTGTGPASELDAGLALLSDGADRSSAQALAERVRAAIEHMNDAQLAAPLEAGVCVPILARALSGDAEALGHVTTYPELDDEEEDDDENEDELLQEEDSVDEALLDELVRGYGEYVREEHGHDSAVWRHGEFISCALLDWKRDYHDGHPTHWTVAHVSELMLDYAPRKMTMDDEAIETLPDCLAAFMRFLDRADKLEGDDVDALTTTCARLRRTSIEACRDPSHWSMAKSIVMRMIADGVDPADPVAGEAWLAEYNTSLAAARNDSSRRTQKPVQHARSASRTKRSAVKEARRRNRR